MSFTHSTDVPTDGLREFVKELCKGYWKLLYSPCPVYLVNMYSEQSQLISYRYNRVFTL